MNANLLEKLKRHWLIGLVLLFSSGVGIGWTVAKALLVEPRDFEIARLERILSSVLPPSQENINIEQSASDSIKIIDSSKKENAKFNIFMMYYPSKKNIAQRIHNIVISNGFSLKHFQEEPEGSLSPRISEIIFYSESSKNKALELQDSIFKDLGIRLPLSKSPYYGNRNAIYKIYINIF